VVSGQRRWRVLVAGTAFGRIYLDAIAAAPESFVLAGVLARGSEYSRRCALGYGVPLYTETKQVPDDIDIACVVVRSGATGGPGSELSQALLERGVHVLQEHPVHATEIAMCLRAAKNGGAAYAVNTLYPNIRAIRQFLNVAGYLRERQRIEFIDAACNSQVSYPLLDVMGRAAGALRPWSFAALDGSAGRGGPFRSLVGSIGGIPLTLRVQNQVHPEDADNHSFLLHRLSIGCEAGVLSLADTHGPVLWNPRLHAPRDATGRLVTAGTGTERLSAPSNIILGDPEACSYHDVFARLWPDAVLHALRSLCGEIADPDRRGRRAQWDTSVSLAWRDMSTRLGMPELIRPGTPQALPLEALKRAAAGLELLKRGDAP
jgi:pyochelin biosynthesis protein PchG